MARLHESLAALVRTVLARERLPESPPLPPLRVGPSLLRQVFAAEKLPAEAPLETPASDRRPSLARVAFAPEALPREPGPAAASRSRWFAWLFSPERIDDR